MTLNEKCRRHWQSLGITDAAKLKDFISTLFTKHDHQRDVLIELYKLVFPEWDEIARIKGYPEVGNDMWLFVCGFFQKFDQHHHPGCLPGGAWMNTGFSVNHNLEGWEIKFDNCEVEYNNPILSERR